jgi:hypothetical protein
MAATIILNLLLSILVGILVYFLLKHIDTTKPKPKVIEKLKLMKAQCDCFYDDDLKYGLNSFLSQVSDEVKKPVVFRQLTKGVCMIKRVWRRQPGWVETLASQSKKLSIPVSDRKATLVAYLDKERKAAMDIIRSRGWLDLIPDGGPLEKFFEFLGGKAASLNFNDN